VKLDGPSSFPVVVGHVLVVAAEPSPNPGTPSVRGLDVETGAGIWGPVPVSGEVLLAADVGAVFVLDVTGTLEALDAEGGAQLWSVSLPSQFSYPTPPVASNGLVYVNGVEFADGTRGNSITYALDEPTGAIVWSASSRGSGGAPAVSGALVLVGESCGEVAALDALTGSVRWRQDQEPDCMRGLGPTPGVSDGVAWTRDTQTVMARAWNLTSGAPLASTFTFGSSNPPLFAFDPGTIYYVDFSGTNLVAADSTTLRNKWAFPDDQMCTSPVVAGAGGQVFVAGNILYEIDSATGIERSRSDLSLVTGGWVVNCSLGSGSPFATETHSLIIAGNHLFVSAGYALVAY
jgi:outer membrane protein assembly factor BamB